MKYITGDIVEEFKIGKYDVLVHGCNCFCTMGSGVAKAIRAEWPEVYEADCKTRKGSVIKLGTYSTYSLPSESGQRKRILNAYTQYGFGRDGQKYVEYAAIKQVCKELAEYDLLKSDTILIPMIGAGLGGGDWGVIESIFDFYLPNRVTCCVLEG